MAKSVSRFSRWKIVENAVHNYTVDLTWPVHWQLQINTDRSDYKKNCIAWNE